SVETCGGARSGVAGGGGARLPVRALPAHARADDRRGALDATGRVAVGRTVGKARDARQEIALSWAPSAHATALLIGSMARGSYAWPMPRMTRSSRGSGVASYSS